MAVAALVLILVIASVYLYYNPSGRGGQNTFSFPTSSTTTKSTSTTSSTSHPPPDQATVDSAVINNGTLSMHVLNKGPGTTSSLTVMSLCTPAFRTCYDYKGMAGAYTRIVFVLPPKRSFVANMTGVCTMPIPSCHAYYPVAGSNYYLQVKFSYADGQSVLVPIIAMANSTWSRYPTAILNVSDPSLMTFSENLSGIMSVSVTVNSSLTDFCFRDCVGFTAQLDGYLKPSNGFSGILLTNKTIRCGGNSTFDCTVPLTATLRFYTVLTGIIPGPYYAIIVRDTTDIATPPHLPNYHRHPSAFALWVLGT